MKRRILLTFSMLLLIIVTGCTNGKTEDTNNPKTDNTEEVENVETAGGIKIDYAREEEQNIFGDTSKEEIDEIINEIFQKVSSDEDSNTDLIIEEVFKNHGITDENNLAAAKSNIRITNTK